MMSRIKFARQLLGFTTAAFFVWLIARQLSGQSLAQAVTSAQTSLLFLAVVLFFIGYACRITRWKIMLSQDNPSISWKTCAAPYLASISINNVLPFRSGDVLRAFAFTDWLGVNASNVLATIVVERLLDILTLLLFLGLALLLLPVDNRLLTATGIGGASIATLALIASAVLFFPELFRPVARFTGRLLSRVSENLGSKLISGIDNLFDSLVHLAHRTRMVKLFAWSLIVWGFEGLTFYCVARAIPSISEPLSAWLALPIGTIATLLPSTPGYIGTFDYFVMIAMQSMGSSTVAASAYAIIVHVILWLPVTLVGGACFIYWINRRSSSPLRVLKRRHS